MKALCRRLTGALERPLDCRTSYPLQDFRTTVQTEGGAAGGTLDELRHLARHTTRDAGEHYVMPDARAVEAIQEKRLVLRDKEGIKV